MFRAIEQQAYPIRVLFGSFVIVTVLLGASIIVSYINSSDTANANAAATQNTVVAANDYQDANAVAVGMTNIGNAASNTLTTIGDRFRTGTQTVLLIVQRSSGGTITASGSIASGLGKGSTVVAQSITSLGLKNLQVIGHGTWFAVSLPGKALGNLTQTKMVSAVIKPAEHDAVPIIDSQSPELKAAQAAVLASQQPVQVASSATTPILAKDIPRWPLNGTITTLFGVPELPYQAIHTGLDISDGKAPGITPVYAFKSGTVISVVHSYQSLGNHVVIDHGSGITSVYGHLDSTSVSEGQIVDTSTAIGFEGTTGVSTGTHLHFEIRISGQATDPHNFIAGQP